GTDGWANCSIQITMPGPTGSYTVAAFNSNSEFASTTFQALKPSLAISPTCGPDNTASIAVDGRRWAVGYDAGIYLDGVSCEQATIRPTTGASNRRSRDRRLTESTPLEPPTVSARLFPKPLRLQFVRKLARWTRLRGALKSRMRTGPRALSPPVIR